MCWWVITSSSMSSIACPRAASACSSSSSAFAEFGPESTSVSGESSIRYALTRPTMNGVGIARRWMPASAASASASRSRLLPRILRVAHDPVGAAERISASTSSRRRSMSAGETSDSRHRRSSGSVFEERTLKCQSS